MRPALYCVSKKSWDWLLRQSEVRAHATGISPIDTPNPSKCFAARALEPVNSICNLGSNKYVESGLVIAKLLG